jgi:predicted nucleic acid-binding protein
VSRSSLVAKIPAGDRLLLDTSVLAAFLDATDATHPVAVYVLKELVESGRNPAVVSMITVMEILVRPLRQSPPGRHTVLAFLRSHPNLEAVSVDLQVAQEAATLRATHRFAPPDALIVGTGIATQVGHLVTNDGNWKKKLSVIADRIKVVQIADHLPFP